MMLPPQVRHLLNSGTYPDNLSVKLLLDAIWALRGSCSASAGSTVDAAPALLG